MRKKVVEGAAFWFVCVYMRTTALPPMLNAISTSQLVMGASV
jgi:hypothetical protein